MPVDPEYQVKTFGAIFSKMESDFREVVDKYTTAIDHISDWAFLLSPVLLLIKEGMDSIKEGLDKLAKLIDYALRHQLPVVSLVFQAFRWVHDVQRPLNGVYAHQDPGIPQGPAYHNEEIATWEGAAKTVYDGKVTAQVNAVDAMATKADDISQWLMEIAQTNVEYMTKLATMVGDFLKAITEAAIDAATVIGIPFSVSSLSDAISALVSKGIELLVQVANRFMNTLERIRDTNSWMNDKALPAARWPQAVHPAGA